jgi:branched-chain amino acid transport system substrate-binding protein
MDTIFISDDGVKDDTFIKVAGSTPRAFTPPVPWTFPATPWPCRQRGPQKSLRADPGAFYLNAYAAALALLNAIEKAGSTDYDAVTNALRTKCGYTAGQNPF